MTPNDFVLFLQNPANATPSVESALQTLQQYPYCLPLRLAILKKMKMEHHSSFDNALSVAATYTSDRFFLKDFLEKTILVQQPQSQSLEDAESLEMLELESVSIPEWTFEDLPQDETSMEIPTAAASDEEPLMEQPIMKDKNEIEEEELQFFFSDFEDTPPSTEIDALIFENEEAFNFLENDDQIPDLQNNTEEEAVSDVPETELNASEKEEKQHIEKEDKKEVKNELLKAIMFEAIHHQSAAFHHENVNQFLTNNDLEELDDEVERFDIEVAEMGEKLKDESFEPHVEAHFQPSFQTHTRLEDQQKTTEKPIFERILENIEFNEQTSSLPLVQVVADETNNETEKQKMLETEGFVFLETEEGTKTTDETVENPIFEAVAPKETQQKNMAKRKQPLTEAEKEEKKARIKDFLRKIAEQSLDEEEMPISETLAELLAKQGKMEQSIRMYQQLILNNPQKKTYFAEKIKALLKQL